MAPLWKQAVGSTIHCAAGDATGIIVAAAITGYFGLRMGVDIWLEYAAGFAFGLFIFQALLYKGHDEDELRASPAQLVSAGVDVV
ncbi:DUF4396 domain-containing protein [Hymenobacter defluvii]|uniref:DUF4396 domain-containing protein n=1 Tax=Hymenobacter defluvii TaxID=2054411 RepID=A0ABS3TEP3_9BACT|nr:DUF4396 domain-containing protein [Hymenobacter defluvii]